MNVEQLVEDATSDLLIVPLWQANLDLSDLLASGRRESIDLFATSIRKKVTHANPKVLVLAVTLLDSVAKNGNAAVWDMVGRPEIATPLRELAEGKGGSEAQAVACSLLQDLAVGLPADASARLPFQTMYRNLQTYGVSFPPPPRNAALLFTAAPPPPLQMQQHRSVGGSSSSSGVPRPHTSHVDPLTGVVFAPTPTAASARTSPGHAPAPAAAAAPAPTPSIKLWGDLRAVRGCVALAARTLVSGAGQTAEEFLDAADLLAQSQPRLVQLIEAGASGEASITAIMDEALFEECLAVNDAVARVLEAARSQQQLHRAGATPGAATHMQLVDLTDFAAAPAPPPPAPAASLAARGGPDSAAPQQQQQQQQQRQDDLLELFGAPAPAPAPQAAVVPPVTLAPPTAAPAFAALTRDDNSRVAFSPATVGGTSASASPAAVAAASAALAGAPHGSSSVARPPESMYSDFTSGDAHAEAQPVVAAAEEVPTNPFEHPTDAAVVAPFDPFDMDGGGSAAVAISAAARASTVSDLDAILGSASGGGKEEEEEKVSL